MRERHGDHSNIVSKPNLYRRPSDMLLNLPLSGDNDDDDDEIVGMVQERG